MNAEHGLRHVERRKKGARLQSINGIMARDSNHSRNRKVWDEAE
jgi:hypothetical protein